MKSIASSALRRNGAAVYRSRLQPHYAHTRYLSTEKSLQTTLHSELTSRPANKTVDHISPNPWKLLNISLADFLPPSCQPRNFNPNGHNDIDNHSHNGNAVRTPLPLGHHLVYFPPPVPDSSLFSDGTDDLHSPGTPFTKRLWGGGSIVFNPHEQCQLLYGKVAVCGEHITDVNIKGTEGHEKVFVTVQRKIASLARTAVHLKYTERRKGHRNLLSRMDKRDLEQKFTTNDGFGPWAVIEERNLVFLREKSREEVQRELEKVTRVVKPVHSPDFSISLTPNKALLFRFSALSFNAHRIHLDQQYTREVEGHRNLLVHGPLTIVLMLSVLRSQIPEAKMVTRFDYRNLAPLYVDEEMKICVRRDPEVENKLDVWVEGREGGLAVKGTAIIGETVKSKKVDTTGSTGKKDGMTVEEAA